MIGLEFMMMLMLLLGQAGQDMLDLVSTDAYWKEKNVTVTVAQLREDAGPDAPLGNIEKELKDLESPDFAVRTGARKKLLAMGPAVLDKLKPALESKDEEVAAAAREISDELSEKANSRAIRRLMAIRTLGEKKDAESLPLLKTLLTSKTPFVAEYAARAIAAIEGKPYTRTIDEKALTADLARLPKSTGIVGQLRATQGEKPTSIDDLLQLMLNNANEEQREHAKAQLPKFSARLNRTLIETAERIGNVRLDSVTLAVSEDIGPRNGWFVFSIHGQFDADALIAAFEQLNPRAKGKVEIVDGVKVLRADREGDLLFPSNQHAIIHAGARPEIVSANRDDILAALKTGKAADGGLAGNDKIQSLLKNVDTAAVAWAVGLIPDELKRELEFAPFEDFTLTSKAGKKQIDLTLTSNGNDADALTETVKMFNEELDRAKKELDNPRSLPVPLPQATKDMLNSVKIVAQDKKVTATGTVTQEGVRGLASIFLGYFSMMMGGMEAEEVQPGIAPVPPQVVPDP